MSKPVRAICQNCDWEGDLKDWVDHAFAPFDSKGKSKPQCKTFEPLEKLN